MMFPFVLVFRGAKLGSLAMETCPSARTGRQRAREGNRLACTSAARKVGEALALRQEAAPLSKRRAIYRNVLRLLACLSPRIERKANVCSRRGTVFRGLDCMILPQVSQRGELGERGLKVVGSFAKQRGNRIFSIRTKIVSEPALAGVLSSAPTLS